MGARSPCENSHGSRRSAGRCAAVSRPRADIISCRHDGLRSSCDPITVASGGISPRLGRSNPSHLRGGRAAGHGAGPQTRCCLRYDRLRVGETSAPAPAGLVSVRGRPVYHGPALDTNLQSSTRGSTGSSRAINATGARGTTVPGPGSNRTGSRMPLREFRLPAIAALARTSFAANGARLRAEALDGGPGKPPSRS